MSRALALARLRVLAHSAPPILDRRTGFSSPAPVYLVTMSSWVAGT